MTLNYSFQKNELQQLKKICLTSVANILHICKTWCEMSNEQEHVTETFLIQTNIIWMEDLLLYCVIPLDGVWKNEHSIFQDTKLTSAPLALVV